MRITPKSAKDIQDAERKRAEQFLIPNKTECDFEVMAATDEKSRAGNDMIHLKLKVFWNEGYKLIDDYLLDAMEAKLRHFCEAVGLLPKYEAGTLTAQDCDGVCGKVLIKIKKATADYDAKNEVRDYVTPEDAADKGDEPVPETDPNDPF